MRHSTAGEMDAHFLVGPNIVGMVIATTDNVVDANDHYLQMIGYSRTDLVDGALGWQETTPSEWRTMSETAAAESTERSACTPYETELLRRDGTRVPVLISRVVVEREPLTFIYFVLDLTKMNRLEVALHLAEHEAERSKDAVRASMSRLSHDLRSPLNVVLGFGQLLQHDDLDTDQRASVEQIIKAAHQLLALINETLDISRIEKPTQL